MANKDNAKLWFQQNDYPTETQFAQLFDWLRWTDEDVPLAKVTGLQTILNALGAGQQLPALTTTTIPAGGVLTIAVPAGKVLEYFVAIVATDYTALVGSTSGGSEYAEIPVGNDQPNQVGIYKHTASNIFIGGLPVGTVIKYKIF